MCSRNVANGLNLYLGSQLIHIVGFEFSTMGSSLFGDPNTRSSLSKLFFFLTFWVALLTMVIILHSLFSRIANTPPPPSLHPPTYSLRWVERLWLIPDSTCVDGGPIPSFLSGCSVGNGGNGIETGSHLQKVVRQWYFPGQYQATETLYPRVITLPTKLQLIGRDSHLTLKIEWSRYRFWVRVVPQSASGSRS